ncbi:MAG: 3-deoxy-D-manno-octulosonic acid transferase [Prevotella sp.]|nr:3-deoxy-D-manno-octulosonic acid transferase [Bacteroides sp.]MCM1366475.1 3-deoxy-D-manno-octulosonic acid transferase [Prevotella sp.]MCM1436814.1 3-deoxy-D-manno-octulosonic acid transferase [Prevotella sp.]
MTLESTLYSTGIEVYSLGVRLAAAHNPKARKMIDGHDEIWEKLSVLSPDKPVVWVHAASLGEFEQGRPVMERIREHFPDVQILLTFFSPSGYEIRKDYPGADCVCYLPFDKEKNVKRFLDMIKPRAVIFVKYEIWRNYLSELRQRNIPTYLISAAFRPNQAFFKPYGKRYAEWLKLFSRIFVQDEASRQLLAGVGIEDAVVAGDTRFDRVTDIMKQRRDLPAFDRWIADVRNSGNHVIVAGSSWEQDENVYLPWLNSDKKVRAIIAPHEFDEGRLDKLRKQCPVRTVLYSELVAEPEKYADARVVIVDCFGLLSSIYRFADIAYIGGGFGVGIHNLNEAAVYGVPIIFGPNYHRFIEAEEIIEAGGGFSVADQNDFENRICTLLDPATKEKHGKAAGEYIKSKLGASDKIFDEVFVKGDIEL